MTAMAAASAFAFPRLGGAWFARMERMFARLAQRQGLAVAIVGLSVIVLRLAILPLFPVPLPFVPDDFSFLLACDTFVHGRLANPTPAMWTHFESIHITMQPTYQSMYFPGQGLLLAAGKVLLGNPWIGLLIVSALMCAALCWMLQAWLPPSWALLGGAIAVLRLGVFSYWTNTYHAGGSLGALGGALILGGLPRLMRTARMRYAVLIGIGIAILVLTRPYEGILLCLPVGFVLVRWMVKGKNRPQRRRVGAPGRGAACVDDRRRGVDGLLRLSRLRQPAHAALHGEPQHLRDCSVLCVATGPARAALPLRRDAEFSITKASWIFTRDPLLDGLCAADAGQSRIHVSVFLRLRAAASAAHGAARFSRPAHPVPGDLRAGAGGRNGRLRFICCRTMSAPFTGGVLCHRIADDAPPAAMEARRKARGARAGAVHGADRRGRWPGCASLPSRCILRMSEWPPSNWNFNWFGPGHYGTERAQMETWLDQQPGSNW